MMYENILSKFRQNGGYVFEYSVQSGKVEMDDWVEIKENVNVFEIDPEIDNVLVEFSPEKLASQRKGSANLDLE